MNNTQQKPTTYGLCKYPKHDQLPIIGVCPVFCGYHKNELLCEICRRQCQKKESVIIFEELTFEIQAQNEVGSCATYYHKNQEIVALCRAPNCDSHYSKELCQLCAQQCCNKSTIAWFEKERALYNNYASDQQTKVNHLNQLKQDINVIKEQQKQQKMTLINSIKINELPLENLNHQELNLIKQFIEDPKQRILGKQFDKLDEHFSEVYQIKEQFEKISLDLENEELKLMDQVKKKVKLNQDALNIQNSDESHLQDTDQKANAQAHPSSTI